MASRKNRINTLTELMSPSSLQLLAASGTELVAEIGLETVRSVVLDVLMGRNLRDSTETLTRRRIAALNLATVDMFLRGSATFDEFVTQLPDLAGDILARKKLAKSERWLAQWVLGLTDKAFQNVLRDDPKGLVEYRNRYISVCNEVIRTHIAEQGVLSGYVEVDNGAKISINWLWFTYLLNTIGAQTLAIRGSEKSAYGKLFEKLVLGSLLHILGYKHISPPPQEYERVFWLSSQDEKRESDATLLLEAGQGVRFDIGFIGRGNPEISLDKVTRFEREIALGPSTYYMATIILVDRIGANSRIERMAQAVEGTIIQMSAGYWPKQVALILNEVTGYKHALVKMNDREVAAYLTDAVQHAPLEQFIGLSQTFGQHFIRDAESDAS